MKRKGSALLIVLGMMAFMIVSAVAFSAYMRSSRLPSSYLRRSSASRQLAKAAVAEAIDAIDRAVANNPHPGVGSESVETDGRTRNIWPGRVLLATNRVNEVGKTVPVLTLEALAYIPPPLVNEVRYYSRLTSTAAWKPFGFDSGRYAFCAVDVSDYLDVNRLVADKPRSSAPVRRISLSYLFESREHASSGTGAAEWDTFMERFRSPNDTTLTFKYDSMVPLVSLADLNLALGEGGKGGLCSPFCVYVNTPKPNGFYDNGFTGDQLDKIRRMTFVTDSWLAGSDRASDDEESDYDDIYDLTDPQYQPFPAQLMGGPGGGSVATLMTILQSSMPTKARLLDSIPGLSLISLFDYLDSDKVPVSLACPTFERTPMICGLKPNMNGGRFALRLEPNSARVFGDQACTTQIQATDPSSGGGIRDAFAVYEYKIDPNEFGTALTKQLTLGTLSVYPFPHDDAVDDTTFTVDGRAVFFLSQDDKPVTLRTGSNADRLHAATKNMTDGRGLSSANGTITVPFKARSKDFAPGGMEEQDAIFDDITLNTTFSPPDVASEVFARIVYKWQQTYNPDTSTWDNFAKPTTCDIVEAHCGMPPLNNEGEPDSAFAVDDNFKNTLMNGGKNVTLCMALMARVADRNDKTVDLVPAHILDDKTFNNLNNSAAFPEVNKVAGSPYPVMLFTTDVKFSFSGTGLAEVMTPKPADFTGVTAVRIDDPRYNYAPESWYDADGDISKQTWLDKNRSRNRDGDIFLATSDQGYMQSIYELAFLPRLSNLQNGGGIVGPEYKNPDDGRTAFDTQENAMNSHIMWSSYRPFATKAGAADDFEGMGFASSGTGFRVNPYSDSTNVLMAAFANTPVDWRLASTNNREVVSIRTMKSSDFNKDYAWNENEDNTETTFKWKDLEAVAGEFMERICPRDQRNSQSASYTEWKTAWRNLGWMYDPDKPESFCGVNLSSEAAELWGVDRKFLYGYWRDCFAAKQQLFLVFVRAEPFMMGGQGVSQSPPQLGARAVALVWRDPAKSQRPIIEESLDKSKTGYPHRTRVLFYRQFE